MSISFHCTSSSLDPVDEWSKSEYSHQNAMKQIDLMQSHLENLKESLMKSRGIVFKIWC